MLPALTLVLALVSGAPASCKTAITDPPRAPRHTLTEEQRDLVLERLNAELPGHDFTDVELDTGIVTVTYSGGQTCSRGGFGSVRLLVNDRDGACELRKRFVVNLLDYCLEK